MKRVKKLSDIGQKIGKEIFWSKNLYCYIGFRDYLHPGF